MVLGMCWHLFVMLGFDWVWCIGIGVRDCGLNCDALSFGSQQELCKSNILRLDVRLGFHSRWRTSKGHSVVLVRCMK